MKNFSLFFILFFILYISNLSNASDYIEPSQEFRGVWVSPFSGDINYKSQDQFVEDMNFIFDTIKEYKMNAIIFHVRINNDALYQSDYNPLFSQFKKVNFTIFDPINWIIEECHKRGIEFHAWMNPYRIVSKSSKTLDEIITDYIQYPKNPASQKSNIMEGKQYYLLNPGLQNVRDFLIDTVLEFLNKYKEVDAIHFDDYFYNNPIESGDDQEIYKEYIDSHPEVKDIIKDKSDWRREQVNLLIHSLHNKIVEFNQKNNKNILFGISPSGIYKTCENNNESVAYDTEGNAITSGVCSNGMQHYESHLFCDSLKWINKGWIDYIIPQIYWAHDHDIAPYKKIIEWWNKVVLKKNINLYGGIGLYKCYDGNDVYSWRTDENELYNQLTFSPEENDEQKVEGFCIFQFTALKQFKDNTKNEICSNLVKNGIKAWKMIVPPSEIKSFNRINLPAPENCKLINNGSISFKRVYNSKFYIIYRTEEDQINFNSSEIIDIFGSNEEEIIWNDKEEGNYTYGVKALSYSNTLGEGAIALNGYGNYIKSKINYFFIILLLVLIDLS